MNKKRDHTKMICDVGELSGLFKDSGSLEAFLQKIVDMIALHMHADVCSIYLFDDKEQKLILKANKGFNPSSIGNIKLDVGEGLTGRALKEMRPICVRDASQSAGYRYFENIGEEQYESFLAVPILHGQIRIGVVVIQNAQTNYFNEEDITALRAITSQMANTIEMTKLLMDLEGRKSAKLERHPDEDLKFLKGKVGAQGFALGRAVILNDTFSAPSVEENSSGTTYSSEDFQKAVETTEKQLEILQQRIEEEFSDVASLIFAAQILMLKDKPFMEAIEKLIEQGTHPVKAVRKIVDEYVRRFDELPNVYLKERKQDVRDIGRRLLRNLTGADEKMSGLENCIVIAREMFPSEILKLFSQNVKGLILLSGGVTSHLSILAGSLGIPLIIAGDQRLLQIPEGTQVLIDGEQGNIHITPAEDVLKAYYKREEDKAILEKQAKTVREATFTKDGTRITLLSNINLLGDAVIAQSMKTEGIGLYRTEFPFLVRSNFPSEEEQYIIYKKLAGIMQGKEITFRTLDIGGDKFIAYHDSGKEANPFLGMRSIRFSLRHKDVFKAQIRAMLRAGAGAKIKIMFPMISSVDEFLEAKAVVHECMDSLKEEKASYNQRPQIGMMVELPAVLEIMDELAREADFFSVGTNDFVQYMLAVDRTNEKLTDIYLPHHPAVLRALKKIVAAARRNRIGVCVCGEMAHDQRYIPYLLGIGVREFSLDARRVPKIQEFIEGINLSETEAKAGEILKHHTVGAIEQALANDAQIFVGPKKILDKR